MSALRPRGRPRKHFTRASSRMRIRQYQSKIRKRCADLKLLHGCVDCGYREHPDALEFDHVNASEKFYKPSDLRETQRGIRKLEHDLARGHIVVRCANCHRIKTRKAADWAKKKNATPPVVAGHEQLTLIKE